MPESISKRLVVDLCPSRPDKKIMDLGETRVGVEVTVSAKKKPAPIVIDRLIDKAANPVMEHYREIVQDEVNKLAAKFVRMKSSGDASGAAELAKTTTHAVKNACASLQGAVTQAVQKQIKLDYRDDQNLIEAQVKVAVKVGFKVISVGKDITMIAVSMGANVAAWLKMAKGMYEIATMINDGAKDEKARRQDLLQAIGKYSSTKTLRVHERAKAETNKAKLQLIYKDVFKSVKAEGDKAEAKRKHYKAKVTSLRQELEKLSERAGQMETAMKGAPNLKEGVKIGAVAMKMKGAVKGNYIALQKAEKFADDMAMLLTLAGVEVDDKTFAERIQSLKAIPDLVSFGSNLKTAAKNIYDMVGTISKAA